MEPDASEPLPVGEIPPAPPPAPRGVTSADRGALLMEPRVRRWWLMALAITVICIAFSSDRLWARHMETQLIRDGLVVKATIMRVDNKVIGQPFTASDHANLQADLPGGKSVEYDGFLSQGGVVGGTTTLRVNPMDQTEWTDRTEPTPLLDSVFVGILALPVVPLLILAGYLQLRKLQAIWDTGSSALAQVFERKVSPIAPRSYAIRASLPPPRDPKLFTVYVPRVGMGLDRGDSIWVITGKRQGQPLAALWMPPRQAGALTNKPDAQQGDTA